MKRVGHFTSLEFTWNGNMSNYSIYLNGCKSPGEWISKCRKVIGSRHRQCMGKILYWLVFSDVVSDELCTILCNHIAALMTLGQNPSVACIRQWDDAWWNGANCAAPVDVCRGYEIFTIAMYSLGTGIVARVQDVEEGFEAYKTRLVTLMPLRDEERDTMRALNTVWSDATNYLSGPFHANSNALGATGIYHGRAFGIFILTCISFARFMRIVSFQRTPLHVMKMGVAAGDWNVFMDSVEETGMNTMKMAWFHSMSTSGNIVEAKDVEVKGMEIARVFEIYTKITPRGH